MLHGCILSREILQPRTGLRNSLHSNWFFSSSQGSSVDFVALFRLLLRWISGDASGASYQYETQARAGSARTENPLERKWPLRYFMLENSMDRGTCLPEVMGLKSVYDGWAHQAWVDMLWLFKLSNYYLFKNHSVQWVSIIFQFNFECYLPDSIRLFPYFIVFMFTCS